MSSTSAGVAETLQLHLDARLADRAWRSTHGYHFDGRVGQARHVATVGAQEMGVLDSVRLAPVSYELESPHVVSQVGPRDEARFDQVHQIAIDRGSVEAKGGEPLGDIAMAEGGYRRLESLQDRDTGRRPTKPGGAKGDRQLRRGANRPCARDDLALDHVHQISARPRPRQRADAESGRVVAWTEAVSARGGAPRHTYEDCIASMM